MDKLSFFKDLLGSTQKELKEICKKRMEDANYDIYEGKGFLYGTGDIPILLVAHLDTVHTQRPNKIYYDKENTTLWSPQGIGGDDRCGVFIILKLIKKFKPYVLFTEDEEIGAIGAMNAIHILKQPKVKFIIEIDRRGNNDCVFYDCGNEDFKDFIKMYDFKEAIGSFSDISVLADEWDIASVNLSSGYYNEHTTNEIINLKDMINTYKRVADILMDEDDTDTYYDYQEIKYDFNYKYHTSKETQSKNDEYHCEDDNHSYEDEWGYTDNDGNWHWWEKGYAD